MQLFAFLLAAVWPLAKKVLVSLGIGWVTYSGLTLIVDQVKQEIVATFGQVGGATMQILTLSGIPQAVGIVLGALTAGAALLVYSRLQKVTT